MASVTIFDQMSIGPHVQLIGLRARDTCKQWSCDWSLVTSGDLDLWITLILQVNVRTSLQLFRSKLIVIAKQVSNEFVTRERHGKRIGLYSTIFGGLGGTTGSASDSRSEGRGFDSH